MYYILKLDKKTDTAKHFQKKRSGWEVKRPSAVVINSMESSTAAAWGNDRLKLLPAKNRGKYITD